jgi:hypothetical protein
MSESIELNELVDFLTIAEKQGYLNEHTAQARRTACSKLFSVLEPDQRTIQYVRDNIGTITTRFQNLNREVRGNTVEEYRRRVQLVLDDYSAWSTDRAGWERSAGSKGARSTSNNESEKKQPRSSRTEKPRAAQAEESPDARTVTFPLRPDFELSVTMPRDGLSVAELKKLLYFMLPYAKDWEPSGSPQQVFAALERTGTHD